jgi:hypothetical protein
VKGQLVLLDVIRFRPPIVSKKQIKKTKPKRKIEDMTMKERKGEKQQRHLHTLCRLPFSAKTIYSLDTLLNNWIDREHVKAVIR